MSENEELAKLMGIEPKYKRTWAESEFQLENRAKKYNVLIHWDESTDNYYIDKPLKIDFTKPSNFVKLYEMPIIDDTEEGDIEIFTINAFLEEHLSDSYEMFPRNRKDFINNLIHIFKRIDDKARTDRWLLEPIKRQAQQIEWEY